MNDIAAIEKQIRELQALIDQHSLLVDEIKQHANIQQYHDYLHDLIKRFDVICAQLEEAGQTEDEQKKKFLEHHLNTIEHANELLFIIRQSHNYILAKLAEERIEQVMFEEMHQHLQQLTDKLEQQKQDMLRELNEQASIRPGLSPYPPARKKDDNDSQN